jgi:hypothetical protein
MMKKLIYFFILAFTLIAGGCKKDFFDINADPNGPTRTTPDKMLTNVLRQSLEMQGTAGYACVSIIEQLATQRPTHANVDNWVDLGIVNYSFQNNYFFVGSNNESMMKWAAEEGSWHYVGIGEIIKAITYGYTTDLFGEIYYDQAIKDEVAQPAFNTQDYVYKKLFELLDDAILQLNKPGTRALGAEDIFYGGDLVKWKKLANAVKARLLNHLSKKTSYNPAQILELIDNSLTGRNDDAGFTYSGNYPDANAWAPDGALPSSAKTWDKYFIELLKGNGMGGVIDPRLPKIVNPGSDGVYRGVVNGITKDGLAPDLVGSLWGKFYTDNPSPFWLFTYEEVKFIESEAAFRTNNKSRAYTAYIAGITSNLERLGVNQTDISVYLSSAAVAQNAASLTVSNIMVQKYIALTFHPELWTDMRRYDYSNSVYPNLVQPVGANAALSGKWVRRLPPFSTEIDYNKQQVESIGGLAPDYVAKPVWWDQP